MVICVNKKKKDNSFVNWNVTDGLVDIQYVNFGITSGILVDLDGTCFDKKMLLL